MNKFSEKIFITLTPPTEEEGHSDQLHLQTALLERGYEHVQISLPVLQKLYPLCRESSGITVTLVWHGNKWTAISLEPGNQTEQHYGLAVDYGSTTIHMQLVDLNSGTVLTTEKMENGQITYGTDILTRITYALEGEAHTEDLKRATLETLQELLLRLTQRTGIDARKLPVMILSGNTTMIHFLLGLNAWTVFASPYVPITMDPGWLWGRELGLDFAGLAYIIPAASNYIGGDIVSGLLTLDIQETEEIHMFFDIGTNGELVLGCRDWIVAGAGAAGPALEGYISRYGMRANPGAIDHIKIKHGTLSYTTIAEEAPVGICGSGIIDLLAQMLLNGWINIAGKLQPERTDRILYLEEESQYAVVYATAEESALGTPLFFTQTDIDQYCDTKAAAYTMIDCLLESVGCTTSDISHCHLSGAFPAHSDLESAITIGIFPDLPRERYSCTANTSLDGARALLLNRKLLETARILTENMYCIQFASIPDFLIRMQAAKFIPHTDMERYPSVQKLLSTIPKIDILS